MKAALISTAVLLFLFLCFRPNNTFAQGGIVVSGADTQRTIESTSPSALSTLLQQIQERIRLDYGDRFRRFELQAVSASQQNLLEQVQARIRLGYADRARYIALQVVPDPLQGVLAQVKERVRMGYVDRALAVTLTYPNGIFPDNQPATISAVGGNVVGPNAVVNWSTNEFASCTLHYGTLSGSLNTQVAVGGFLIEHQIELTGLTAAATYLGQIHCLDRDDAASQSTEFVIGDALPDPTTVPSTPSPTVTTPAAGETPVPATPVPTPDSPSIPSDPAAADEYEANNDCVDASAIAVGSGSQSHTFHSSDDIDWATFNAEANANYSIEVQIPADSTADLYLELHVACSGLPDETFNNTFTPGVRLEFKAPAAGAVYLRLANQDLNAPIGSLRYDLSVRQLSDAPNTGAVIILAGRYKSSDPLQRNIHNVTDGIYALFQANGYTAEDIKYLATDPELTGSPIAATAAGLRTAIVDWAKGKVSVNKPLSIYLVDHGDRDVVYIDEVNEERVTPDELDGWLSELEAAVPGVLINVFIEACHSGSFIQSSGGSMSKEGRVVITSSNASWDSYASRQGAHFSDQFITSLQQGRNLFTSFLDAKNNVQRLYPLQDPWLDGDGDGRANEAEDYAIAAQRGFAYAGTLGDQWPPYNVRASGQLSEVQNTSGTIQAEVRDNGAVKDVWAVIYPPSYRPPQPGNQLVAETLETLVLTPQGGDQYAANYSGFTERGIYRIVIQSEDDDGLEGRPIVLELQNGHMLYLPLVRQ